MLKPAPRRLHRRFASAAVPRAAYPRISPVIGANWETLARSGDFLTVDEVSK
jgi:hypothetical protein